MQGLRERYKQKEFSTSAATWNPLKVLKQFDVQVPLLEGFLISSLI
jgi:hypothetical protein